MWRLFRFYYRFRAEADATIHDKLQKYGNRLRSEILKTPAIKEIENSAKHSRKDSN